MNPKVTNVVFAGLGGQGVLKASDIFAEVVFCAGFDVKKAEIHGMSQRGGSVTSDVRFGEQVHSPMVSSSQADYLVVLSEDQLEVNQHYLAPDGVLISSSVLKDVKLPHPKSGNVVQLGILSTHLSIEEEYWHEAIRLLMPEKIHDVNLQAFALGRSLNSGEESS
ncbi:MAG: indolepyruvate oxidoreductase subunit beta [Candidatus Hinthialibacter antarcticus]|nr:indolepyruvate oxidoreductase subunit beta [Candidatus Hinthialibacter antarcticus]